MPANRPTVLILAAGIGKRLRSKTIKLLHPVAGRPMVTRVAETCRALRPERQLAVIGPEAEHLRVALAGSVDAFAVQDKPLGTGHAVLSAARLVGTGSGRTVLIVNGDLPTLRTESLRALIALHRRSKAALTLVTALLPDASGYGRIVRDARGGVARIVEDKDASREERSIREINCGIYCADWGKLLPTLKKLRPDNAQGEYYLTDCVHRLLAAGEKVAALQHGDPEEVLGVNTRAELARAGMTLYARKAAALQDDGVSLLDPARIWIEPSVPVGRDTVIYPDVLIEGDSAVGEDCIIRSGCRLVNVRLGAGVEIKDHCVLLDSVVGSGAEIGPFAHLRPGNVVDEKAKIGNFVELKKTRLGKGSKAPHLSYLGDASIGAGCNIGAGTITCNYDGVTKHPTTLGTGVFIGSDSQLVAPVTVGDGAYIGAGTTVTQDVPPGALAISRVKQVNLEGWVERRKRVLRKG